MTTPGFRGARPFTDADAKFFRSHGQAVNEAIQLQVEARDRQIKAEIRRLGHDPDSTDPIPDWIVKAISERMALGEFDGPLYIKITEEE